jgi:hypothetical protein
MPLEQIKNTSEVFTPENRRRQPAERFVPAKAAIPQG